MDQSLFSAILPQVILPIIRLSFFIIIGLVLACFIESLGWSRQLAILARPLIRLGRLSNITGASFSIAFFSGVSANAMLSEAYAQNRMDKKELILANLFNSLPRFFLHLPTVFFLTAPFIQTGALYYVGLTFSGAVLQTILVVFLGRIFLKGNFDQPDETGKQPKASLKNAINTTKKRVTKRISRILKILIPVYFLFFLLNWFGLFQRIETFVASQAWFLKWLNPQALGIVILHVTTEFSAGLSAASVLLANNSLNTRDVVLALLAGNLLATPVRAIRHQFPYYMGIYNYRLAIKLVGINQLMRAFCILTVTIVYYFLS